MLNFFKKNQNKDSKEDKNKSSLKDRLFKSKKKLGDGLSSLVIGKKKIDEDLLEELEVLLISSDIGIQTTDKVIESVRKKASRKELKDEDSLYQLIKLELESLLVTDSDLEHSTEIPFVILVVGINGAGKTTTIGKLAKLFQGEGKSVMLAAGDTFRAAAVEQLKEWSVKQSVDFYEGKINQDPASVAFQATEKFKRENGLDYSLNEVMVSCGGKQVFYNLCQAILNSGDEVIIPTPYWVSYPDMAILADATPVFIETGLDQDFKISPEQLEASITPNTKLLVLNSPSNPTGSVYSKSEIEALGAVLERYPHVLTISDDIYEHIRCCLLYTSPSPRDS
mgnify:CR=1 FL=1